MLEILICCDSSEKEMPRINSIPNALEIAPAHKNAEIPAEIDITEHSEHHRNAFIVFAKCLTDFWYFLLAERMQINKTDY